MSSLRVFVVTGSNKGIGKSIVKLLLQDKEEKIVYLTSRNEELGKAAVKDLQSLGLEPHYHQLDVTDSASIESLKNYLLEKYDGLDVLVNNAGIAYKKASTAPFSEQAEVTNNCNFFGALAVCEALFPIMKKNGRVVHVSSLMAEFAFKGLSHDMKTRFGNPNLTMEELKSLMVEFNQAAKDDTVQKNGFAPNAYGMSKVGMSLMAQIQQKEMDKNSDKNILINSCSPGYVATELTSFQGPLSVDEGADTPVFMALIPVDADSPKGSFYRFRKEELFPPHF